MTLFRQALALLALAAVGAFGWHLLAADPGYVLLTFRGYSVETTLIVAVIALGLLWLLARALLWLLRTPFEVWRRQRRQLARERLAGGLLALEEGHWKRADKLLGRAAGDPALRIPTLLAACRAAQARGETERAAELLAEVRLAGGEEPARLLDAERLIAEGQHAAAAKLLAAPARRGELSPRGIELLVRALGNAGRSGEALEWLPALRKSRVREGQALLDLEAATIAAALRGASNMAELDTYWQALTRAQRLRSDLADPFAARAAELGDADAAIEAIVRALKKHWSETLARRFGKLPHDDRPSAIRLAERWLEAHPDSAALRLGLGRLCRQEGLWGKAEDYLLRALEGGNDAEVWEALAELYAAQDDDARARQAYANALRAGRGEAASQVRRIARETAVEVAAEERSSMGVPRLPAGREDYP